MSQESNEITFIPQVTDTPKEAISEKIKTILQSFIDDKYKLVAQKWALHQGMLIEFYSSQLAGYIEEPPQTIREALLSNDRELYKMCIDVRSHGERDISKKYGNVLAGGRVRKLEESIDDEGRSHTTVTTIELSPMASKKLLTPEREEQLTFLSMRDELIIESHFGIVEKKFIIPERLVNKTIRNLQTYQFEFFQILNDYLNVSNRKIECTSKALTLHLVGGYQSGKTVSANTLLAVMINVLANNRKKTGDYMIMSAKMSSLHRNVINRLCSMYPMLTPPSINSTVWKLGCGVKLNLLTTQLIAFHSLKGCSLSFCYVDELDSTHASVLDLLQTRFTENFDVGKGDKCVIISTSNPQSPDHHVTKYIYPKDLDGNPDKRCITKRVSTLQNRFVTDEYIDRMTIKCGGESTNKYKREILGESVYLSSEHSVFNISEEEHCLDQTIDNYINMTCNNCSESPVANCGICALMNKSLMRKDFIKVNIGLDFGTSVQTVFCCTFLYIEEGVQKAIVLDELVYDGGFDASFSKQNGFDALKSLKEMNIVDIVKRCSMLCPYVTIYVPHDCPHQFIEISGIKAKYGLRCNITRPPTPAQFPITRAIDFIRDLFNSKRLTISNSCKNLKSQLFEYSYDHKYSDLGEEKIKKTNDHSVDAMRYSLVPDYNMFI